MNIELKTSWEGSVKGFGNITDSNYSVAIAIPVSYGGSGKGFNPKQLLISSSASCFIITLTSILQNNNIQAKDISITTKATGDDDFIIEHYIYISLESEADHLIHNKIKDLVSLAGEKCKICGLIRKAGIKVTVIPIVV